MKHVTLIKVDLCGKSSDIASRLEPHYSRNVEELAEEFNVFFTSMGVRAAEAAAGLAAEHNHLNVCH